MRPSNRLRAPLVVATLSVCAALACNALVGLDTFQEGPCGLDCGVDAGVPDTMIPDNFVPPPDTSPPGDGSAATHWATWPMPNPVFDSGSDANFHTVSYQQNTGAVTDNVTKLVWNQTTGTAKTIDDARAFCKSIDAGMWRLPTRIELVTLIDFTRASGLDPILDSGSGSQFWSDSPDFAVPGQYWIVDFAAIEVKTRPAAQGYAVRCVEGQ